MQGKNAFPLFNFQNLQLERLCSFLVCLNAFLVHSHCLSEEQSKYQRPQG